MIVRILILVVILSQLTGCKSYLEYTHGTGDLSYSFNNKRLKRFSDLDKALEKPEEVIYLDWSLSNIDTPSIALERLNQTLPKFTNLKKLVISGSESCRRNFPDQVFQQTQLEFLVIQFFPGLKPDDLLPLKNLTNLKFLSLQFCQLDYIPASVYGLPALEGLDMGGNNLSSIPEIEGLNELITLDLTNNCFKEFPQNLSACKKLKYLDINNAEGVNLQRLQAHGMCANIFHRLDGLDKFESLERISLFSVPVSSNHIEELQQKYPHIKFK